MFGSTGSTVDLSGGSNNKGIGSFLKGMGVTANGNPAPAPQKDASNYDAESLTGSVTQWASQVRGATEALTQSTEHLTTAALLILGGSVCMFLAFTFLPFIVLSPHKFASLFTFGSLLIMCAFALLRGVKPFVAHATSSERLPFTAGYVFSLVGTIYASLFMGSYLLTLIFSLTQMVALAYFVVSYVPGGTRGLTFIGESLLGAIKSLFK